MPPAFDDSDERILRLSRARDAVRRTAQLLSADRPLEALLRDFAELLGRCIDARRITVRVGDDATAYAWGERGAPHQPGEEIAVRFGGRTVGTLGIAPRGASLDDEALSLVETCALYLGARLDDELQRRQNVELERMVATDALTGLSNRRAFDRAFESEWRRCARSGKPLALALIDVDFFKAFNDAYGHVAGDAALRQVARAIADCAKRPGDLAARYGGEEFALVLPECDAAGASAVAEELCAAVRALRVQHQGSSLGYVTVSAGVAAAVPHAEGNPEALLALADEKLYRAKGLGRNRVAGDEYASEAPEAHARIVARDNLPTFLTPLVGRERDVADLVDRLRQHRLVTIAGPGGIGKTRVAVEVARLLVDERRDGAWFADLGAIVQPELVPASVAAAIGLELPPGADAVKAMTVLLRPQHLLLVLDCCERLIEPLAEFAEALLRACPRLSILATSREPFGIAGESVRRLDGLEPHDAFALFVERAGQTGVEPSPAFEAEAIGDICRRLDGIPLAVELAASWTYAMPPRVMLARLDELLGTPAQSHRGGLGRQQTLRALIDWSYDLLSEEQREAFRRTSVFAGSFSLEAANAVAGSPDGARWDAGARVAALADKSLLAHVPQQAADAARRYRLLDSMQYYALERLRESGEERDARLAHARYFCDLSDALAAGIGIGTEDAWLDVYEPDLENFRAALAWSIDNAPHLAARLVGNLRGFWQPCGLLREGLRYAEAALGAVLDTGDDLDRLRTWLAIAWLSAGGGRGDVRGIEAGERALELARALGDEFAIAESTWVLGLHRYRLGSENERGLMERRDAALALKKLGNPVRGAIALLPYAYALASSDPGGARALLEEQLAVLRARGWPRPALVGEANLAEIEFSAGDSDRAIERSRRVIELRRGRKDPITLGLALANLASYLAAEGRDAEGTAAAAREAVEIGISHDVESIAAYALQAYALTAARAGNSETAANLLGYVDGFYERIGSRRERTEAIVYERALEVLRARCSVAELERGIAAGRTLTMEDAASTI